RAATVLRRTGGSRRTASSGPPCPARRPPTRRRGAAGHRGRGHRRRAVVTAPLPAGSWADIGWGGREVLGDAAHAYVYAQRTADDRIALGGRGVPYRFGSRLQDRPRRGRIGDS